MEQKTERLYQSATLENKDWEQRLEKKINDIKSFNKSNKERITHFKDKTYKSKKKYRKFQAITTIIKSFVTFVIIAATSSSIIFSLKGTGLKDIQTSTATACGLSIGNKIK